MKWLKGLLVLGLLAVVGMAFRVSWNALRDVALATGADPGAADLYAFVVDGLLVVALVAALILTKEERRFALRVLGGYTAASLALNYVHGMVPGLHQPNGMVRLADWPPAHWALVLLATSLPVGSIYFGSELVAKVLHHQPAPAEASAGGFSTDEVIEPEPDSPTAEAPAMAWPPAAEPRPESVAYPEPVPAEVHVPVAYPERPEVVPAAARLLPIVARPEPTRDEIRSVIPPEKATVAAPEVRVPEPKSEPEDATERPEEDPLTDQARHDFRDRLKGGQLPPFRKLRATYRINQERAQRIRDELTKTLQPQ